MQAAAEEGFLGKAAFSWLKNKLPDAGAAAMPGTRSARLEFVVRLSCGLRSRPRKFLYCLWPYLGLAVHAAMERYLSCAYLLPFSKTAQTMC